MLARTVIHRLRSGPGERPRMAKPIRAERRKERIEIRLDRRKTGVDVIEHVLLGVRREHLQVTSNDRIGRSRFRR
jgi:hypothetical protein